VVVLDDYLMGITHVIRGADHIANTPRQILIGEALGAPRPVYAHAPLVMGKDGKKLSKRHTAVASLDYREVGYLSDAFLNFLALVGWNPGTEQEVFSREELIQVFSLEKIQKSPAVFNEEKLRWINKEHIRRLPEEEIASILRGYCEKVPGFTEEVFEKLIPEILDRISVWQDVETMISAGEIRYFFEMDSYDSEKIIWKKSDKESTIKHLEYLHGLIEQYDRKWEQEALKEYIFPYADENGRGDVLWPLRYSLSGKDKSPDPFSLLHILGKEESLKRIKKAIDLLK
jgi:glutamyl-tRNA synthetase